MKESPGERRIAERMAPGVLSREGFMGTDRRPLSEIIDADFAEVTRLGTTHEALALELGRVLDAAVAAMGAAVTLGANRTARYRDAMGRMPCPFGGCGVFPKGEVELSDPDTGETIRFTPLSVHMVAEHGFYQGRGSPYRLDPAALVRLLATG